MRFFVLCVGIALVLGCKATKPEGNSQPKSNELQERYAHLGIAPCSAISKEHQKLKNPPPECRNLRKAYQEVFQFYINMKRDCESYAGFFFYDEKNDRHCSQGIDTYQQVLFREAYRYSYLQKNMEPLYPKIAKMFPSQELQSLGYNQNPKGEFRNPTCLDSWRQLDRALVRTHEILKNLDRWVERYHDLQCALGKGLSEDMANFLRSGEKQKVSPH